MTEPHQQETTVPSSNTCWELLERLAESPQLKRSARMRDLLLYVGRRSLKENCEKIHEQEIGVDVFGRPQGYDTNVDNIVRTNATELRKRIDAYFGAEGSGESLIVEIPRGSYVPVFHQRVSPLDAPAIPKPSQDAAFSGERIAAPALQSSSHPHRGMIAALTVCAVLLLATAVGCLALWNQNRALQRAISPWRYSPSLAAFWSGFLNGTRDTDIVMEDSAYLLYQNVDRHSFSANDYINRSFLNLVESQPLDTVTKGYLKTIWGKKLDRASDVELAMSILALDRLSKSLHLYNARDYPTSALSHNSVILLGNPTTNPWDQLFEDRLNFKQTPASNMVTNATPAPGEQSTYESSTGIDYCTVAYLPKPDHTGNLLIFQGTSSEATKAGGDYLLSEANLADLRSRLHADRFPYFEVLLKVSHLTAVPITTSIQAFRVYPNLK